jgi:phage pi2 protein 07
VPHPATIHRRVIQLRHTLGPYLVSPALTFTHGSRSMRTLFSFGTFFQHPEASENIIIKRQHQKKLSFSSHAFSSFPSSSKHFNRWPFCWRHIYKFIYKYRFTLLSGLKGREARPTVYGLLDANWQPHFLLFDGTCPPPSPVVAAVFNSRRPRLESSSHWLVSLQKNHHKVHSKVTRQ